MVRYLRFSPDRGVARAIIADAIQEIALLKRRAQRAEQAQQDAEYAQAAILAACIRRGEKSLHWGIGIFHETLPDDSASYQTAINKIRRIAGLDPEGRAASMRKTWRQFDHQGSA
jgi:hypothetical protein